jgi:hypothetical protein
MKLYPESLASPTNPQGDVLVRNGNGFADSVSKFALKNFDGGREGRTPIPMRIHGNTRIINPGHCH